MPDLTAAVPALEWLGLKVGMWESEPRMWVGDESDIFLDRPDKYNAEARDLILDALEAKGYWFQLGRCAHEDHRRSPFYYCFASDDPYDVSTFSGHGDTRTAAVLNAAIAAHKAVKEMEGRS